MLNRVRNRFKFQLEQLIIRGAQFRLLVIAACIGLVSIVAGLLVLELERGSFSTGWDAIWWAFLRLTDPGYLGDDEGVVRRVVSTVVTVLGYVLFLGALIAIMTQWLDHKIRQLESGLTPIAQNDHVLVLGWTHRTPSVVRELLLSEERVKRFLRRHGARRLNVVLLAERVNAALVQELRDELGPLWNARQITFRSGTPLEIDHLRRVDFANAAAILLPGGDFSAGGPDAYDTRTIKTLLSISNHARAEGRELPLLVTEIFDARKLPVAVGAYEGPVEILASELFISRLMAQNVRHRGLSHVFSELLAHGDGNEIYVRACPQFSGLRLQDLAGAFPRAVLLGVLRADETGGDPILNPPDGFAVEAEDKLVLMAPSYAECEPPAGYAPQPVRHGAPSAHGPPLMAHRRILLLGWSHKVPALLREFDSYASERFAIDMVSTLPVENREEQLRRNDVHLGSVQLAHYEGDYTVPSDLKALRLETYDNVVILGSDRVGSEEESDARTILGYLLLSQALEGEADTEVLIEMIDPENLPLFRRKPVEILLSSQILSHMLAQVALRRELRKVFDELFGPGGAEIFFRPVGDYGLEGQRVRFAQMQEAASQCGEIALGVYVDAQAQGEASGVYLNPDRDRLWDLNAADELIVLATYA